MDNWQVKQYKQDFFLQYKEGLTYFKHQIVMMWEVIDFCGTKPEKKYTMVLQLQLI